MKTVIFAATAAACILATPAMAQDDTPFSGPRAEALTGYDKVNTNSNGLGSPDGVIYGIGLGYDLRAGNAVVGVEAELADSTASRNVTGGDVDAARPRPTSGRACSRSAATRRPTRSPSPRASARSPRPAG